MTANQIHLNDIGTQFLITIKDDDVVVDLSSANSKKILFRNPNGDVITKNASLYTDGTDGKIVYTTVSGDLNIAGRWKLQADIQIGGSSFRSDISSFRVYKNL